jgi:hypothetical protein
VSYIYIGVSSDIAWPIHSLYRAYKHCHERQLQGLERKAKVEGSQLRLYKAKEGRK